MPQPDRPARPVEARPPSDDDRLVDFADDDAPLLPEQTRDDTDLGWGERASSNDERLLVDRPPHWD